MFTLCTFYHFLGFVTDREFNSLRTMGAERPLSIIELIAIARKHAKSDRVQDIKKYLTPVVKEGTLQRLCLGKIVTGKV
jgi:hypothetical protein